jgi:hypothetical protein
MNPPISNSDYYLDAIDSLVAGELDEPRRRRLFAWLDEDPLRWKQCALAFLEAQVWEQAIDILAERPLAAPIAAAPVAPSGLPSPSLNGHVACPAPRKASASPPAAALRWRLAMSIAALVAIAFALGAGMGRSLFAPQAAAPSMAEGQPDEHDRQRASQAPLVATVAVGSPSAGDGIKLQLPVVEGAPPKEAAPRDLPEYVRQQWLRQGWQIQPERKYLPARLADGSSVVVPIDRLQAKYVGKEVY